jgi:hypothetical protein
MKFIAQCFLKWFLQKFFLRALFREKGPRVSWAPDKFEFWVGRSSVYIHKYTAQSRYPLPPTFQKQAPQRRESSLEIQCLLVCFWAPALHPATAQRNLGSIAARAHLPPISIETNGQIPKPELSQQSNHSKVGPPQINSHHLIKHLMAHNL